MVTKDIAFRLFAASQKISWTLFVMKEEKLQKVNSTVGSAKAA